MCKYNRPFFVKGVTDKQYERWLVRKAIAHVKRDGKHRKNKISYECYKIAIHKAVELSKGKDAYTGEQLRWDLISKWDNNSAKIGGKEYKSKFALLPTVDHLNKADEKIEFQICSWRTNDAKSDLSLKEFINLSKKVIKYSKNVIRTHSER